MRFMIFAVLREAGAVIADLPLRKRVFLLSRMAMSPRVTSRCVGTFATSGLPARLMLEKPLRDYARRGLSTRKRFALLLGHYTLMQEHCPGLASALWSGRTSVMGSLAARECSYRLVIGPSFASRQEGEVCISLEDEVDGLVLGRITFLLASAKDGTAVVVGGLQGAPAGTDKGRIVQATRRLSGLRPKAALLAAVQAFAAAAHVEELHAVGRDTHVASGKSRSYRRRFHAPYDDFWIERGAVASRPFGYRLPLSSPPAEAGTAQERRREAHREAIRAMVAAVLTGTEASRLAA